MHGIRDGNDRTPGLQRGDNSSLGNADALLLHGLMDTGPVAFVHLVELVDQADALVCDHQRPAFQSPLLGLEIPVH
jgi:hypothetical protein